MASAVIPLSSECQDVPVTIHGSAVGVVAASESEQAASSRVIAATAMYRMAGRV